MVEHLSSEQEGAGSNPVCRNATVFFFNNIRCQQSSKGFLQKYSLRNNYVSFCKLSRIWNQVNFGWKIKRTKTVTFSWHLSKNNCSLPYSTIAMYWEQAKSNYDVIPLTYYRRKKHFKKNLNLNDKILLYENQWSCSWGFICKRGLICDCNALLVSSLKHFIVHS